jgi:hypothetical protein
LELAQYRLLRGISLYIRSDTSYGNACAGVWRVHIEDRLFLNMDFAFGAVTCWSVTWLGLSVAEVNRSTPQTKALKRNYASLAMFNVPGCGAV